MAKALEAEREMSKMHVGMQLLIDPENLRDHIKELKKEDKGRVMAYLCSSMRITDVARMLGTTYREVQYYADKHKDIREYAKIARASTIVEMCQRKAIEMLQTFDPEQVPQEKRPQAIKYLIEGADKSAFLVKSNDELEDKGRTRVKELIFRVTERMQSRDDEEDEEDENDKEDEETVINGEIVNERKEERGDSKLLAGEQTHPVSEG